MVWAVLCCKSTWLKVFCIIVYFFPIQPFIKGSTVIEHAIQHHLQSHVPAGRDKLIERGIPAQSHIDMHGGF